MCVIIHKPAGFVFDDKKLTYACERNNDGYGFAILDRGKLEILKRLAPGGNDPKEIITIMEQSKDLELFLHLRFKTVGDKTDDNCHPFPICEVDGVEYALMHNGTMTDFDKRDGKTDSYHFGQDIVKPLIEGWHYEDPLDDSFVQKVLAKFCGAGSKVAIFNSAGTHHIINKSSGSTIDGCWVSNTYSFDEPKAASYYGGTNSYWRNGTWDKEDSKKGSQSVVPFRTESSSSGTAAKPNNISNQSARTNLPVAATTNQNITITPPKDVKPVARISFVEASGSSNLEEVTNLGAADIVEMVKVHPEWAVLLILDLVQELYGDDLYGADEYVAGTNVESENVG